MPEMGGLETLRQIRRKYQDLCVIMFSTLTEKGGQYTLEALALGANDYVTKAANVGSLDKSMARLRDDLIPKIKQFFIIERPREQLHEPVLRAGPPVVAPKPAAAVKRQIVVIGVSTGGPNALAEIFPHFPERFPCPVLVVQHMPPLFTRMLADRLSSKSRLPVREAGQAMQLEPGVALVAPGDYHMELRRNGLAETIGLHQGPPENSCRPAVDVLFRSVARLYGARTLAIILTGMGQDGLRGIREIKAAGGYVLAQDQASSVVWGMPGCVVEEGLADKVTSLDRIVPEILKQV
jgi:two-component system chemotaxis response regulator CheB